MSRSHRASKEGIQKLYQTFYIYGRTQDYLAGTVGCTRQTVNKFLAGRPIDKRLFQALCDELRLNWQDIAELEMEEYENSRTVGSINRTRNTFAFATEETISIPLKEGQDSNQTIVTYITNGGEFVIKIPGDINSFLQNVEEQNIWLEAVKRTSGDQNVKIVKIERGSIKIIFNVSQDGIKNLAKLINSGKLEDNLDCDRLITVDDRSHH
ncbi:MAG: hypothetical protein HCA25_24750 [Dolichospermum sp. DET50]|nr:hypothetical protein [Dolichospermum sp. DET66]MBS3035358.1 hypothetical protein [Dolichospermum sp. DET67]MBS3040560.1 hypothetical protein [Dolichospermum sp. DET50]QSX67695.1 MAG: hypothetical protein EZY12_24020 [Dolichospermum sp. DET69]